MKNKYNISKSFLYKEYITKKQNQSTIAKIVGCGVITISRRLREYKIKTRTQSDNFKGEHNPRYNSVVIECLICHKKFKIKKSRLKRSKVICCSRKCSAQWRKTLKGSNAFSFKDGRTTKKYHCIICGKERKGSTAYRYQRCFACARKYVGQSMLRENHWNWQGGISFEPYPLGWNKTFKEQIRYRDQYKCQTCGVPETECNRKLDVHHIDYDKENLSLNNLISLCKSCHCRTNFNREYWKNYFDNLTNSKEKNHV